MADNTIARYYGKVRNVRLQIGFQAYFDFLILHIPVDREIPLLVGRPYLYTYSVIYYNGKGIMTIDDGVVNHVYHARKRNKIVADEDSDEEDWLDAFKVRCDENGNPKYGPTLPPFFEIEDEMEHALAMDYSKYRKIDGDEDWGTKFEITCLSGRKFTRWFKTKENKRKLTRKFDILSYISQKGTSSSTLMEQNPIVTWYVKKGMTKIKDIRVGPVKSDHLKWSSLDSCAKEAYNERLSKLLTRSISLPKYVDWELLKDYGIKQDLVGMIMISYKVASIGEFKCHVIKRALKIKEETYKEWRLEFFLTIHFNQIRKEEFMDKKCIWFRLCGREHNYTLMEFAKVLGLYTEEELEDPLFARYFKSLDIDEDSFNHMRYWMFIGKEKRKMQAWIVAMLFHPSTNHRRYHHTFPITPYTSMGHAPNVGVEHVREYSQDDGVRTKCGGGLHVGTSSRVGTSAEIMESEWDQVSILAKDKGFGQEMHQSEEPKALYGVTSLKDYAVTYSNEEMCHHTLYGVKCLQDYAATFKYTRDDVSDSALWRNICDRVTP
ncbi:hypothetical protein Tco_0512568 [Tanacetum coccineum]